MAEDAPHPEPPKRSMPRGRPFQKGVSGNPGGKPRTPVPAAVVTPVKTPSEAVQPITDNAHLIVASLVDVATGVVEAKQGQVQAACKLLDKLVPNAIPPEKGGDGDERKLTALEEFVARMRKKDVPS